MPFIFKVPPAQQPPTGTVTISGTATQGQTLTASNTLADVDGLGTISYQWKANGVSISGATSSTFVLQQAQVGKVITVTASYTDGFGAAESVTSSATTTVNAVDANFSSVTLLLHGDGANGGTTFTDSSSNGVTVSRGGSTTTSTTQIKYGSSSLFFGSANGNYLSLSKNVGAGVNTNYTFEGWIYPTAASSSAYSITFGNTSGSNVQLMNIYPGGEVGYYNGGTVYKSAAGKIAFNQWNHFAVVRRFNNTVNIYINGVDVGLSISDTNAVGINVIGGYGGSPTVYNVIGYMDDIRITPGVARYTGNFTPPTAAFPNS